MLTVLDHIVLICADIDVGVATYATLFGRAPEWRSVDAEGGSVTAVFRVKNTALELMAPKGEGRVGKRLCEILNDHNRSSPRKRGTISQNTPHDVQSEMDSRFRGNERNNNGVLTSLAFATDDIKAAHHTLSRRGLSPSRISKGAGQHIDNEAIRTWSRFRLDDGACAGVKTFVLEREAEELTPPIMRVGGVSRLDHLVINTPHPTRAIAHYAGRLGLRFALDRTIEKFGTRFLFFRIGGLTLEVIHRLDVAEEQDAPDTLWGMTWEVQDLSAAHGRLKEVGVNVSDIRTGRKPGTEVFTLRDNTLGIPTLFLAKV